VAQLASGYAQTRRDNIVVILADDLGYGDLSCFGGRRVQTPNLDRLAREGMRFTDFHSNGAVCSPTRAALLTGRYPQRAGIETALGENARGLDRGQITLARRLRDAGYSTALFGKWHLGYNPENGPQHHGFAEFRGLLHGAHDYFSHVDQYGRMDWWHNDKPVNEPGYTTHLITRHASRYIESHKDQPFFLYVSHAAIHFPWMTPDDQPYRQQGVRHEDLRKLGPHQEKDVGPVVCRMIASLDDSVGQIMAALRRSGLDHRTLVFFTSDNGGYLRYQGGFVNISDNGPLRGQKGGLYEGGHRVPGIAWWPGQIKAGSVCREIVATMDLMPTMLALAGTSVDPRLDGIDLLPCLLEGCCMPERTLFWRTNQTGAVRRGPWKLIMPLADRASAELFHLERDSGEHTNVAVHRPNEVSELRKAYEQWENDVGAPPRAGMRNEV